MVVGTGVDIVEVARIEQALSKGDALERRVFTEEERSYCRARKNAFQHFAGRFAAKEAVLKALGTGWQEGIRWQDVEIVAGESGKPEARLTGRARERLAELKANRLHVSISHAQRYAVAVAVAEA